MRNDVEEEEIMEQENIVENDEDINDENAENFEEEIEEQENDDDDEIGEEEVEHETKKKSINRRIVTIFKQIYMKTSFIFIKFDLVINKI